MSSRNNFDIELSRPCMSPHLSISPAVWEAVSQSLPLREVETPRAVSRTARAWCCGSPPPWWSTTTSWRTRSLHHLGEESGLDWVRETVRGGRKEEGGDRGGRAECRRCREWVRGPSLHASPALLNSLFTFLHTNIKNSISMLFAFKISCLCNICKQKRISPSPALSLHVYI